MTKDQAYRAMFAFLDSRYDRLPSEDLWRLLAEMTLDKDGRPCGEAIIEHWDKAVETALQK